MIERVEKITAVQPKTPPSQCKWSRVPIQSSVPMVEEDISLEECEDGVEVVLEVHRPIPTIAVPDSTDVHVSSPSRVDMPLLHATRDISAELSSETSVNEEEAMMEESVDWCTTEDSKT